MLDAGFRLINEEFRADAVSPTHLDKLLAEGWRHFGIHFFRYNLGFYGFDIRNVIPLRIRLSDFSLSKSQRRVLRQNADVETVVRPIEISSEAEVLFDRHKQRFDHGVPNSLFDFISSSPADVPGEAKEVCVYEGDRLIAASYFDVGRRSTSGIYAMFEPRDARRSLGIYTMLKEIEFSINAAKEFYYLGYCYEGESFYDYKKRFRGSEAFGWNGNWQSYKGDPETLVG